jgi:hypothetical protein
MTPATLERKKRALSARLDPPAYLSDPLFTEPLDLIDPSLVDGYGNPLGIPSAKRIAECAALIRAENERRRLAKLRPQAVKHYGQPDQAAIYYNQAGLTAVLDDTERRHSKIRMTFTKTPEWLLLEGFAKGAFFDQLALIRLLRQNLAHACPSAPTVVAKVRKVRFQASEAIEGDVQRGRESLGKEITAELVQADQVPETVTLQVRPFLELGRDRAGLADVSCLLDIDVHKKGFRLVPSPGEMQEVLDGELSLLESDLRALLDADPAAQFPIFYGTP